MTGGSFFPLFYNAIQKIEVGEGEDVAFLDNIEPAERIVAVFGPLFADLFGDFATGFVVFIAGDIAFGIGFRDEVEGVVGEGFCCKGGSDRCSAAKEVVGVGSFYSGLIGISFKSSVKVIEVGLFGTIGIGDEGGFTVDIIGSKSCFTFRVSRRDRIA